MIANRTAAEKQTEVNILGVRLFIQELNKRQKKVKSPYKPIPEEELDSVNLELLLKEEESRRYEAAVQKYLQWKAEHPILHNVSTN